MKLIFESLNDNKIAINEALDKDTLICLIGGVAVFGIAIGIDKALSKLMEKLFKSNNTKPPTTDEKVVEVKRDLKKELRVLKSIAKIASTKPKVKYSQSYDIYDIIKMGIIDNMSMDRYISTYRKQMTSMTNDIIDILEGEWENEDGANIIRNNKLVDAFGDNGGDEYLIKPKSCDVYYFDHEEGTVSSLDKTYEDLIISEINYIHDMLQEDGLLLSIDDNEGEK